MSKKNKKMNKNPFPQMEHEVLKFWDKAKTFEKSVERDAPNGDYVFYDGPPFGTGEPHYGHLLSSIAKDVVPRYWTMKGCRVERRWGWDCHGLPIENIIEKDMGISGKKEIEEVGIAKFNEACRSRVLDYAEVWDKTIHRIARWVEFKSSYKTMDLSYMESIWWAFKELWKKDLVYQGRKVLLYCPRCETPISNFEVAMDNSYEEITEPSVYVKFKLKYKTGTTGRGVGALIFNDKNEILLVHRNEKGRRQTWALPGGKADKGETFEEAVRREVMEELGVEVESARAFNAQPYLFEGRLFETVNFIIKVKSEPKNMVPDELDKVEWFSPHKMPEVDYPPSRHAINIYLKEKQAKFFDLDTKRPLVDVSILAWTTTPWTLPGNVALAVGKDIDYALVKINNEFLVLAKTRLEIIKQDYELVSEFKGKELVGLDYEPLFDVPAMRESGKKVHYVADADFVTVEDGTGVVHTAVVYGEDDYNLGLKLDLPVVPAIDEKGFFNDTVPQFKGAYFKDADAKIIADLEKRGLLFKKENYTHSYPFCYRCETQLFYNAIPAWFINIDKLRKRMLELNEKIYWFPEYLKYGRFAQGIKQAPDWNISRNRYFATPMPIWECDGCEEREIIGSVAELEEKAGKSGISDIHSHNIDDLAWKCSQCNGKMRRIKEVFDCWVESGSMSFAQHHYPFENKEKFEKTFPAQYISEYISQTRAWFYVMHVMSTALFDSNSFENVATTGVILNEQGEKMSKSKKNFPDPNKVIDEFGADALRFYLMSSSVMHSENINFNEMELRDVFRKNVMLLWNVYKFYSMYADKKNDANLRMDANPRIANDANILDRWILARLNQLIQEISENMDKYDMPRASRPITDFINDLSTWYLRRSRERFKSGEDKDIKAALETTGYVLLELSKLLAPFMPFIAEQIWQKVGGYDFKDENKSVHLEVWPEIDNSNTKEDVNLLINMLHTKAIVNMAMAKRDKSSIKVRQPLNKLQLKFYNNKLENKYLELIKEEVNVKEIEIVEKISLPDSNKVMFYDYDRSLKDLAEVALDTKQVPKLNVELALDINLTYELKQEGVKREMVRFINALRKDAGFTIKDYIHIYWEADNKEIKEAVLKYASEIKKDTLANEMDEGKNEKIDINKEVKINNSQAWIGIKKSTPR